MPKLLCQAFTEYYGSLESKDNWDGLIYKLYNHEAFLYEDIKILVEECSCLEIASSDQYLIFCRNFYQLILSFEFSSISKDEKFDLVYSLYRKLVKHRNYGFGQLTSLYNLVIGYSLGFEDQTFFKKLELDSSNLFQSGNDILGQHLPKIHLLSEKALVLCLTGIQMQNLKLINSSIKCCYFLMQLLDQQCTVPLGLWVKENEFKTSDVFFGYTLLFCFSYLVTSNSEYQEVYERLFSQLDSYLQDQGSLAPLYPLMMKYLEKLRFNKTLIYTGQEFEISDFQEINRLFGLASFKAGKINLNLTCSGIQSGIGTLSKKDIKIVSMGPHLLPLGESSSFGIHRVPSLKERAFKDIESSIKEDKFSFSGWTRVVSQNKNLSDSWLYINAELDDVNCLMNFEIKHQKEKKDVYIAFFVKASKATISTNFHLLPGSLDRYLGKAEKVTFGSISTTLKINTNAKTEMQVIPLAGQGHFWDADFLLAYLLEDEERFSFDIS